MLMEMNGFHGWRFHFFTDQIWQRVMEIGNLDVKENAKLMKKQLARDNVEK